MLITRAVEEPPETQEKQKQLGEEQKALNTKQTVSLLLVLHSKYRPQPSLDVVSVGNTHVSPSEEARNLGAIFDSTMGYERHVSEICKSAFYHIRNISHARRYLNVEFTEKLVHALVTSRLDNCNAVLFGLPDYLIKRLQYVLNAATRLVSLTNKYNHITPIMKNYIGYL